MNPQDRDAPDELDLLAPWRATGRLTPAEAARLDALGPLEARARRLAVAEEERAAAVAVNEAIPGPSEAARSALFARIGALQAQKGARPLPPAPTLAPASVLDRIAAWIAGLSPGAVGFAGAAAALLIVVQAGIIAAGLVRDEARYEVASAGGEAAREGTFALVAFAPDATAARIDAFLAERGASIVDGPRPGGLYRLRIAPRPLPEAERDAALNALRASGLVRLALPAI